MAAVALTLDPLDPDESRDSEFARTVDRLCQENGLIVRPVYNSCVFSPPLVITHAQVDALVEILRDAIAEATAELSL